MRLNVIIERFYSRGQHLCNFIGTKESICIRKEFNSQRTGLGHQHGRRFIVLGHQYGRRDVMWKHSIESLLNKINMEFAAYLLENGLKVGTICTICQATPWGFCMNCLAEEKKWQMPGSRNKHASNWLSRLIFSWPTVCNDKCASVLTTQSSIVLRSKTLKTHLGTHAFRLRLLQRMKRSELPGLLKNAFLVVTLFNRQRVWCEKNVFSIKLTFTETRLLI